MTGILIGLMLLQPVPQEGPDSITEKVKEIRQIMDQVELLLGELKTGKNTQEEEQRIVDELEKLIDRIDSMSSQGGGGGQNQSRQKQRQEEEEKEKKEDAGQDPQEKQQKQPQPKEMAPQPKGGKVPNIRKEEVPKPPSTLRKVPIKKGPELYRRWGNLPPRERADRWDQPIEEVPDRFQRDVERYRKRLAEED